jgi:glycosyltransferase involved in cell wall biosynthesis
MNLFLEIEKLKMKSLRNPFCLRSLQHLEHNLRILDPLNIIVVAPSLRMGGSERVVTTLLRHFNPTRITTTLIVVDGQEPTLKEELPPELTWIDLGCRRILAALPKLCKIIWTRRPHVVFSTLSHLNLMLAIAKPLLPKNTILIARESTILSLNLNAERFPKLWAWAYRRYYKRFEHIICQSHAMQEDICNNFAIERTCVTVIPNPVNVGDNFKKQKFDEIPLAKKSTKANFIAVGRLVPVKRFDVLIEAINLLDLPDVRLDIIGEGPEKSNLLSLVNSLNLSSKVYFQGYKANPYTWMQEADALILCSQYEGMPNAVIEALACGTPVIVSPIPAVMEVIRGIEEAVAAPGMTALDLAFAMRQWMAGARGRVPKHCVDKFDAAAVAQQYEEVLYNAAKLF